MNKTRWMKRVFLAGLVLLIIGGIGFLLTFNKGEMVDNGTAFNETYELSDESINELKLETSHDTNIQFKDSTTGKNYIEVSGRYSDGEIEQLKKAKPENGDKSLTLVTTDQGDWFNFFEFHVYGEQTITVYLTAPDMLKDLKVDGRSADVTVQNGQLVQADLQADSGDIALHGLDAEKINIENRSGDTVMTDTKGDTLYSADSGELEVARHEGNLKAAASSGGFDIDTITGSQLSLSTDSGEISTANAASKESSYKTSSGDIEADGATGKVTASTDSGSIELDGLKENVSAESSSGDLDMTFSQLPAKVEAKSDSGAIELELPSGSEAIFNTKTDSGNIKVPNSVSGATSTVTLTTSSGDIEVK
ncbi:DUF4097 family beta strand repeat-containing protein [Listeria costaricensis]|uniref:DUF4097 family beta strand repeat-containing protein n=1 Tax=Listeria costaricensis TaxID=2026604 RepID=UPI000C06AC57|nr:DUF4097 family beta strand repeat-containing protein [Listeria costaricensis]